MFVRYDARRQPFPPDDTGGLLNFRPLPICGMCMLRHSTATRTRATARLSAIRDDFTQRPPRWDEDARNLVWNSVRLAVETGIARVVASCTGYGTDTRK